MAGILQQLRINCISRFLPGLAQGGIAIAEQAVFSGSNFLINVLVARWLGASQYGAFALAYAIFLFLSGFYNALVLEPISVFSNSQHSDRLSGYLSSQVMIHLTVTVPIGLLLVLSSRGLVVLNMAHKDLTRALLGLGISLPFMLAIWLVRRVLYILQRPTIALLVSITYGVILVGGCVFLRRWHHENDLLQWFMLLGLSSLLGSIVIYFFRELHFFGFTGQEGWRGFFAEQWYFGRWIILATMLYSAGTQVQIFITASMLGLASAGAFRAIQITIIPLLQVIAAISTLWFPKIATDFGRRNYRGIQRKSSLVAFLLALLALGYESLLIQHFRLVEQLLFEGQYRHIAWLIPVIGIIPILGSVEAGYSLMLRSLQKPKFYIIDKIIAAVLGIFSSFIFIKYWGTAGAVCSLIIVEMGTLGIYVMLYGKWFRRLAQNQRIIEVQQQPMKEE